MLCLRYAGLYSLFLISHSLCAQYNSNITATKNALSHITDSTAYVDALNRLSLWYLPCQLDSSGQYARMAKNIAERIGYDKGQRESLRSVGRYYALRPHRYLSYLFYDNALNACRAAGDSAGVASVLMNIGLYFQYEGKLREAKDFLTRSLNIVTDLHLDSLRAWVLVNYYTVNESDSATLPSAQQALQQAEVLTQKYADQLGLIYTRLFRDHEEQRAGRMDKAISDLKAITLQADSIGLNYVAMYASTLVAYYQVALRQADSLVYQRKAVDYAAAGGYTGLVLPVINALYHHYQHIGDTKEAAKYSRLALRVMVQQQDDMVAGEADYLSYAFGDEWMDSMRIQQQTQHQQLTKSKSINRFWFFQILIITAIAVLLTVMLAYFIRAYRLSHKNAARMADLQAEIAKGNQALQDNDDFKNKLISMIAHDFRTPLYNIVNITGFIDEQALSVTDAANMILEVERTAASSLNVFEEILRWIRTQLSGFIYYPQRFLLMDMMKTTIYNLQHLVAAKDISIVTDIPEDTIIWGDYEMLQFIHRNFLHNAIKFSPDSGLITIKATREAGWLTVSVTDEGAGIDAGVLPSLFNWSSSAYEQERTGKGAGVALIICKDFIDKMNGRINAENNREEGSTFYYQLPEVPKKG
ncbi:Histidine kinase-, DNA gyrase B-, and HSP90-like ATPase [Chitinophaga sp. 180180018-2]|uniref:sensor histidine kinase n=1 Tax=Chitinophaga sp. 212800008-4 TaxID=3108349 RepID=UPI002DF4DAA3|nr:Histidine kinase-, DNA gyrase B-, and HSP90-like ATPase [Chitinophaga sp. 212800010-3]